MTKKKRRITRYENGNYTVELNTRTGIKTRRSECGEFSPSFPELLRMRILGDEDTGMPWNAAAPSSSLAKRADIGDALYSCLHPHQEIVLSMGALAHPQITDMLSKLVRLECIVSIRMSQEELADNFGWLLSQSASGALFGIDVVASEPTDDLFSAMRHFKHATLTAVVGMLSPDAMRAALGWGGDVLLTGVPERGAGLIYGLAHAGEIGANADWCRRTVPRIVGNDASVSLDVDGLRAFGYTSRRDANAMEALASEAINDSMFLDLVSGACALGDAHGTVRGTLALSPDGGSSQIDDAFAELLAKRAMR